MRDEVDDVYNRFIPVYTQECKTALSTSKLCIREGLVMSSTGRRILEKLHLSTSIGNDRPSLRMVFPFECSSSSFHEVRPKSQGRDVPHVRV
jgi:hypothetical protein